MFTVEIPGWSKSFFSKTLYKLNIKTIAPLEQNWIFRECNIIDHIKLLHRISTRGKHAEGILAYNDDIKDSLLQTSLHLATNNPLQIPCMKNINDCEQSFFDIWSSCQTGYIDSNQDCIMKFKFQEYMYLMIAITSLYMLFRCSDWFWQGYRL